MEFIALVILCVSMSGITGYGTYSYLDNKEKSTAQPSILQHQQKQRS